MVGRGILDPINSTGNRSLIEVNTNRSSFCSISGILDKETISSIARVIVPIWIIVIKGKLWFVLILVVLTDIDRQGTIVLAVLDAPIDVSSQGSFLSLDPLLIDRIKIGF